MELEVFEAEMIHAACRDCVFANYDGKTQIGCLAGELVVHKQNPHVKVEECTDGDKEFFVINGGACKFQRNADWVKAKGLEDKWDSTRYYAAKDEVDAARVKVALLILVSAEDAADAHVMIDQIHDQSVPAKEVTFLLPNNAIKLKLALITALRDTAKFKWNILESTENDRETFALCDNPLTKQELKTLSLIDTAVAKLDAQYYCVATKRDLVHDITGDIDRSIRVNGERFLAVRPIDGKFSFLTAQVFAHNHFGRNATVTTKPEYGDEKSLSTIIEKLEFITKDLGKEYLVKDAKEVFKWLK